MSIICADEAYRTTAVKRLPLNCMVQMFIPCQHAYGTLKTSRA
jgi:hypothetical protein